MIIKSLKIVQGRNYINGQKLAHIVWNHYHPDDPWRPGYVVHHKDENPLNDHISNLELMTKSNHMKLHSTGRKFSKETRDKISASNHRRILSEYTKKKISKANMGKSHPQSEDTKIKISKANIGRVVSNETKKKMSDFAKTRIGKRNPNYGNVCSDETKLKISEANKGNKFWLGKKHSEETKRKISESKIGIKLKPHSEETKNKMSIARSKYWAKRKTNGYY